MAIEVHLRHPDLDAALDAASRAGATAFEPDEAGLWALFPSSTPDRARRAVAEVLPSAALTIQEAQMVDADSVWGRAVRCLRLEGVVLWPDGAPAPLTVGDEAPLRLEVGGAFGSGAHPTTALCAAWVRDHPAPRWLDVGAGNGVLALLAARDGGDVCATEIDEDARATALRNAQRNGLTDRVWLFAERPPEEARFDRVVANMVAGPLRDLARWLPRHLAPGARVYLSGFQEGQREALVGVYERCGMRRGPSDTRDGWCGQEMSAGW